MQEFSTRPSFGRILLPGLEPRGLFDDLFGMQDGGAAPLSRSPLLARLARIVGMESLAGDMDALELLASGRPLLMLPARVTVR